MIGVAIGWPGAGKTQGLIDYVRAQADHARFLVYDRAGEWDIDSPRWRKNPPHIEVITDIRQGRDSFRDSESGVWLVRPPLSPLVAVRDIALSCGDCTYVDDEIDLSARNGAEGIAWESNPIRRIIHEGRHLVNDSGEVTQVNLLGAARRPQSVHPDVTAIAEWAMIFRVRGALTLKRLQSDAWIEPGDWKRVRELPNLRYLLWPSLRTYRLRNPFA